MEIECKEKCEHEKDCHYLLDAMVRMVAGTDALEELKLKIIDVAESSEFRAACDSEYAMQEADVESGRDISVRWEAGGDLIDDYLYYCLKRK